MINLVDQLENHRVLVNLRVIYSKKRNSPQVALFGDQTSIVYNVGAVVSHLNCVSILIK
jgi:hypothetical protein